MTTKERIGTIVTNIQGHQAKVLGFKDSMYELETIGGVYSHPVFVHPANFRMNKWKHRTVADVEGVGYIGYGKYSTSNDLYHHWKAMLTRCYSLGHLERQPAYIGCSVDTRWLDYQVFCEDCMYIPYYDGVYEGTSYHLDKDILLSGNKLYSKDTCCFVPADINNFFIHREIPTGTLNVRKHKTKFRYRNKYYTKEELLAVHISNRSEKAKELIIKFSGKVDQRVIYKIHEVIESYKQG